MLAGYRSVAHYLIHKSLEQQAAAAKQDNMEEPAATKCSSVPVESEPSDVSAQTAGGDAPCSAEEQEATADGAAAETVATDGVRLSLRRFMQSGRCMMAVACA